MVLMYIVTLSYFLHLSVVVVFVVLSFEEGANH